MIASAAAVATELQMFFLPEFYRAHKRDISIGMLIFVNRALSQLENNPVYTHTQVARKISIQPMTKSMHITIIAENPCH